MRAGSGRWWRRFAAVGDEPPPSSASSLYSSAPPWRNTALRRLCALPPPPLFRLPLLLLVFVFEEVSGDFPAAPLAFALTLAPFGISLTMMTDPSAFFTTVLPFLASAAASRCAASLL